MDFTSFTNVDFLRCLILIGIFFIFNLLSQIIFAVVHNFIEKTRLYIKVRKVFSGYSDTDIKLFIDYVVDGVSHLEGKHD